MTYDLRREPWIPWRRRSGGVEWGPPALLVDRLDDDPVVALAAPRPDFDGALQEFLIGLLSVALQPEGEEAWLEGWHAPPTPAELQAALDALPSAFDLEGDGPRFFQDYSAEELYEGAVWAIESLLIGSPGTPLGGAGKREFITDLFIKRARIERLGRPAAAMALLTLQTYAPEGGRGHLTSLRGGGPLTTLVDPRIDMDGEWRSHDQPLWRKLWANVLTARQWDRSVSSRVPNRPHDIFPWLAPTRSSEPPGRLLTTPADAHPLQAFFGLPRRIRLEFDGPGRCDLTGAEDERTVLAFRMRTYGAQYTGWRHPLSPYYRGKGDDEWLAVHGQPGGVGWRDWLGLTLRAPEGGSREPAAVVAAFHERGHRIGIPVVRLHAFGYDMEKMKARGWTEAALPAFAIPDPQRQRLLADTAARLTNATGIAAGALLSAVERALFERPEDAPGDLSQVKAELWGATEAPFFEIVRRIAAPDATGAAADDACRTFASTLARCAMEVFDRWCSAEGLAPDALRRLVAARFNFVMTLRGHSKLGAKLFEALRIPAPGGRRAARTSKSRSRKEVKT